MKEYKTYQARNALKAALVTNHIMAAKKNGVSHIEAKAEAYLLYNIKAGLPFLVQGLKTKAVVASIPKVRVPVPAAPPSKLPPLPVPQQQKPALPKPDLFKSLGLPPLPPLPKIGAQENNTLPLDKRGIVCYIIITMRTYKVKVSDGETEWWEKLEAKNDDHLYDIIDAEGWDVVSWHKFPSIPAIVELED